MMTAASDSSATQADNVPGVPNAAIARQPNGTERAANLPYAFAKRFGLLLKPQADGTTIYHAQAGKGLSAALAEAQRFACQQGYCAPFRLEPLGVEDFERLLEQTYAQDSPAAYEMMTGLDDVLSPDSLASMAFEAEDLLEQADDAPVIRLINALLTEAVKAAASDIHLEVFDHGLVARFRVDGVLQEIIRLKPMLAPLLISRIKVMARLDISEKRLPQDGRFSLRVGGHHVDVRVSTIPSGSGERTVLRLLDRNVDLLRLDSLGMSEDTVARLRSVLLRPHGIFLVTGPTGSGKTTTLYASLAELDAAQNNIMTVEDPVEYRLPGVSQTQVNAKIGMTFSHSLRAMLRQDPDIMMVGEIRDAESARISIQSSLTGHFVLATLHTNTAIGAVTRLVDMGMEPFLLSSTLVAVLAQRLVRTLCCECKSERPALQAEKEFLRGSEQQDIRVPDAVGCEACNHTGFKGRTGIYELVLIDKSMQAMIHERAVEARLRQHASKLTLDMQADGRSKVLAGITTVQEVLKVTTTDWQTS